jgi:hypothetical protein
MSRLKTILFLKVKHSHMFQLWGTQWRIWLRHCATNRKAAGSIPDGVTDLILLAAAWSTQPVTELSIMGISLGVRRPVRGDYYFATLLYRLTRNSRSLNLQEP